MKYIIVLFSFFSFQALGQNLAPLIDSEPLSVPTRYWENPNGEILLEKVIIGPDLVGEWTLFELRNESQRVNLFTSYVNCIEDSLEPRETLPKTQPYFYPNPASQKIVLANLNGNYHLKIFSIDGSIVYSNNTFIDSQKNLDVSNLSDGAYNLHISNQSEFYSYLLIIN